MNEFESLGFFDFEDFVTEMTDEQLIAVNGGSCAGGGAVTPSTPSYTPHSWGTCSGGGALTPSNPVPVPTTSCGGGYNGNNISQREDAIDRTDNEYIRYVLEQNGFFLLDKQKNDVYQEDGSERNYYQSLFESLQNDKNFKTVTIEAAIQGNSSAGFGIEEYKEYTIFAGNRIVFDGIDINNDGKIDYAKK